MNSSAVISYILTHKHFQKCFPGWDRAQITQLVCNHCIDEEIAVTTEHGEITGVILYSKRPENAELFVVGILTSNHKALPVLVEQWEKQLPGWRVVAHRRGEKVHYNITQFTRFLKRAAKTVNSLRYADYFRTA